MRQTGAPRAASRGREESGQVFPAMVVVVLGLVGFTLFVIVPLGSGADRRAEVSTAADAAALAALVDVGESVRGIGTLLPPGLGGDPGDGDAISAILDDLESSGCDAAMRYAEENNTDLVYCDVSIDFPYVTSYAETRHDSTVEDTGVRLDAEASAEMGIRSGLCESGAGLGLELEDGSCSSITDLLEPPEPPEDEELPGDGPPGDDGPAEEPEEPEELPLGLGVIQFDQPVLVE